MFPFFGVNVWHLYVVSVYGQNEVLQDLLGVHVKVIPLAFKQVFYGHKNEELCVVGLSVGPDVLDCIEEVRR